MSAMAEDSAAQPYALAERLRERIRRDGAISFHDWMQAALYDGSEGYYVRPDLARWGRVGDYRTAPERSPLFAATFARYFIKLYEELGAPRDWTIFEAGAGAGDFAHGVLQKLERDHPQIFSATRYVIDELSAEARERVGKRLKEYTERIRFRPLAEIDGPLETGIVFANELLDAFPVHRVKMVGGRLRELFVGLDDEGLGFTWIEREPCTPRLADYFTRAQIELKENQIADVNLGIENWIRRAAQAFKRGFLVMVDYGETSDELYRAPHRLAGTLRAYRQHKISDDPLAAPGEQDLTTTVDWTNVISVGEALGLRLVSFERQNEFLLSTGVLDELERMTAKTVDETEALILRASLRELILPGGMSDSFQVMVLGRESD